MGLPGRPSSVRLLVRWAAPVAVGVLTTLAVAHLTRLTSRPAPDGSTHTGSEPPPLPASPSSQPPSPLPSWPDDPPPLLAVNPGRGRVDVLSAFESWLGRRVALVHDSVPRVNWAAIEDPLAQLRPWLRDRRPLLLTVPMLPRTGATLSEGARGLHDHHFIRLAERLVTAGYGHTLVRLGHEANGSWFPWAASRDPAAYRTYWRRIVMAMRSVPGAAFRFDWTVARGPQSIPADELYPGDDVVDVIGMDIYDRDPALPSGSDRWAKFLGQPYGLNWLTTFAADHAKPISVPEWGLAFTSNGNGGGDNPFFIDQMARWMRTHNVWYHAYFEVDAPDSAHRLLGKHFPLAAQRFRELFGAQDKS